MLNNRLSRVFVAIALCSAITTLHAKDLSDPTRPPGESERSMGLDNISTNTAILVSAVFKKNDVFYAVINNVWLKKGEKVGAWRITDITNGGVFLKNENEPGAAALRFLVNENSDFKKQTNNE